MLTEPKETKRRRPRGTGGLSQRKSGRNKGLWTGTYEYEDEYGETRRAAVSSMDKSIARRKLRNLITDIENGDYAPRPQMTVEKWMTYWLAEIVRPNKSPNTYNTYNSINKNQIVPLIGEKRLPITPAVVRGLLKKIGERWSEETAKLTHTVLSKALEAAAKEKVIKVNPMTHIDRPKVTQSEGRALTSDQARKVLLTAMENKDPFVTRWATALLLGARQGEVLGLERDRIDLENLTIELSWQLQTLKIKPGFEMDDPDRFIVPSGYVVRPIHLTYALTRPKTERSKRLTPLPVPLAAILKIYLEKTPPNKYGLVWVTKAGNPISSRADGAAWHKALQRAGVPDAPLHAARHTTATLLQEMKVEESVRMAIMGHSTVAAQRRYAHVGQALARQALGNLDGLLELG